MKDTDRFCDPEEAREGTVRIAWGRERATGRRLHVAEVPRGRDCGCVCIACGTDLVARKPPVAVGRRHPAHHFAHRPNLACSTTALTAAWESGLHLLAKEVIEAGELLLLPPVAVERYGRAVRVHGERTVSYQATRTEHDAARGLALHDIVPDAAVWVAGHPLAIEIHVRNITRRRKTERYAEHGVHAVEIDLSGLNRDATREEVADAVLRTAERRWLHHRKIPAALAAIEADVRAEEERAAAELAASVAAVTRATGAPKRDADHLPPPLVRAGLRDWIGLEAEGDGCMRETSRGWQSRVLKFLYEHTDGAGRAVTASALVEELEAVLVHPGFGDRHRWRQTTLRGLRERLADFATPEDVVGAYLSLLARRGILIAESDRGGVAYRVHPDHGLAALLRAVDEHRRRLHEVAEAATRLVKLSGEMFEVRAWIGRPLETIGMSPAAACATREGHPWLGHPADRLLAAMRLLEARLAPIPTIVADGEAAPPWAGRGGAPSGLGAGDLLGLPLVAVLTTRQGEEVAWRAAAAAARAARIEDAQRADGAAFLAALEADANKGFGDDTVAQTWLSVAKRSRMPGGDTIVPDRIRVELRDEMRREVQRHRAARAEREETAALLREVLATRAPLFSDASAAEAWLRRDLQLDASAPFPLALPANIRSLLSASLGTALRHAKDREAAAAEAVLRSDPLVLDLRRRLLTAAVSQFGSEAEGQAWMNRGRLSDGYQKPANRCRDEASFSSLLTALADDVRAARQPLRTAKRRR